MIGATTRLRVAATVAMLAGPGPVGAQATGAEPQQLVTAVHVHTAAGSGTETMPELLRSARDAGLDALVVTENFGYHFRYGPWPLRMFLEARLSGPTLESYGVERFLADIEAARMTDPGLLVITGAEVIPYYYWSGSLLRGDLTLHDTQRNVLVALPPPGAATDPGAILRGIPAAGNPYHRGYGPRSLALLLPGLIAASWALRRLHRRGAFHRRSYTGGYALDEGAGRYVRTPPPALDKHNAALLAMLAVGTGVLAVNYPYSVPSIDPYDEAAAMPAYEALFDYAAANEALAFWSMPQAVDDNQRRIGPWVVHLSTLPYPEVLTRTRGYSGFGGVYADTVTLWEPGDVWDDALRAFVAGGRPRPPWLIGESAFHYEGQAGKSLGDVVTVLLVEERNAEAAFAALAGGHAYALRRDASSSDLRLREFALSATTADGRTLVARAGDTLDAASGSFAVALRVEEAAARPTSVRVDVVRNGELYRSFEGTTPFEQRWVDDPAPGGDYYRLIVRAEVPAYLVSNPIFIGRRP